MKNLLDYINDVAFKFTYVVKIAGELDKKHFDKFKKSLDKFNVEKCTDPKRTPIQKNPVGFPGLANEEINVFEIVLNYPAGVYEIIELARVCGINPNYIQVINKEFNDSMIKDLEGVEDADVKLGTDYPEDTQEHKDLTKAYSDRFQDMTQELAKKDRK